MREKIIAIALLLAAFSANAVAQYKYSSAKIVDLGLSVKWAGYNLGASSPEEPGGHYAWGDATGTGNSPFNQNTISWNMNICGDSRYDIARAKWGGSWRLPTEDEFKELLKKCTCMVIKSNCGMWGLWCKGPNGNAIFFPLAGEGDKDGGVLSINYNGWYWSGNTTSSNSIFGVPNVNVPVLAPGRGAGGITSFCVTNVGWGEYFSVRPVYDSSSSSSNTPSTTTTPSSQELQSNYDWMRQQIGGWKKLRNGAFNSSGAGVLFCERNCYCCTAPTNGDLKAKFQEINKANGYVEDVNIAESGSFAIVFDGNGYLASAGCPQEFVNTLKQYNARHEKIISVAFDDYKRWAVVGENNFSSANGIFSDIKAAINKYGKLYSVSLTNSGAILTCHEKGIWWRGIPKGLEDKIKTTPAFGVRYIKFTDNGKYIMTDGKDFAYFFL